jgi:putative photosynthetic complex assembly protein 2
MKTKMKTKMKRQGSTELPRFAVGALAIAGASAANAATVQITFNGSYISTSGGNQLVTDFGGDGVADLMGFITGPRRRACPAGCAGVAHFWHGTQAVIWHELMIAAGAGVICWLSWGAANQLALWTYGVLWGLRLSAKLNLFLGVRNLNVELLPPHLAYLASFFRARPMNALFPLSVSVATVLTLLLFQRAVGQDASSFEASAFTLLGTMMALGLVEHWFMVVPLPFAELWAWYLRHREPAPSVALAAQPACCAAHAASFSTRLPRPVRAAP